MKVEQLIYIYIAICISLILFNCVYIFIIRRNAKILSRETCDYDIRISEQMQRLDAGLDVSEKHKKYLCCKLKKTANLTAFDRSMEKIYEKDPGKAKRYLYNIYSVFEYLTGQYQSRDIIKTAYFPHVMSKYEILRHNDINLIAEHMFNLLWTDNVYSRENALKALYSTGRSDYVVKALKIVDKNPDFHHPKLIYDGLLNFSGDNKELSKALWQAFESYSVNMQNNILNYFRFAGIRNDDKMYEILIDEEKNQELRFSCIRYFEKFYVEKARSPLQGFARNGEGRTWEYQAIASSALKTYPDERTKEILQKNLTSPYWYVRLNSAISCEKIGYSYDDLINIFDGNDRYAREILRYRFDRRKAETEVTTV